MGYIKCLCNCTCILATSLMTQFVVCTSVVLTLHCVVDEHVGSHEGDTPEACTEQTVLLDGSAEVNVDEEKTLKKDEYIVEAIVARSGSGSGNGVGG